MNKITYKKVSANKVNDNFLNGYIRFQETKDVLYLENGTLKQKTDPFYDDWDQEEKIERSRQIKQILKEGGVCFAAYDYKQIVGFVILHSKIYFDEYINMPLIHVSKGYRGYGIGKYLFYLALTEVPSFGVEKVYISTHPSVESQAFYKRIGCVLAQKTVKELYEKEPLDIQLEYQLDYVKDARNLIDCDIASYPRVGAKEVSKIVSKLFRYMPKDEKLFLLLAKELLVSDERKYFSIGTSLLKRREDIIKEENMEFFEDILLHHVHEWDQVDQFCYRVMNPMIELKESYYDYLLKWSDSPNKDVRRASLVSMIRSKQVLTLEYDFDKMIYLVEKLKTDEDIHVRKAVGWALKCSYFKYPSKLEQYLRENASHLDRLIYRYALEHVEESLRQELMKL